MRYTTEKKSESGIERVRLKREEIKAEKKQRVWKKNTEGEREREKERARERQKETRERPGRKSTTQEL